MHVLERREKYFFIAGQKKTKLDKKKFILTQ